MVIKDIVCCCATPVTRESASVFVAAHATTMRQAPKEQRQPLRGDQDENLKAYAIRKSDLIAASCESRGSFCGSSPGTHLENGHRTEPRLGQGREKGKQYSENTSVANDSVERQPLHDLNGVVSRTPLGQAITGARGLVNMVCDSVLSAWEPCSLQKNLPHVDFLCFSLC